MANSNQRGGIIRRNDSGTLERIDRTNTYIGTATLESGKVITKRFRCTGFDEEDVARRWLKWQGKNIEATEDTEEDMAENTPSINNTKSTCPFSGGECGVTCPIYSTANRACSVMLGGIGLYNMATSITKLDPNDSLELIALAVSDIKTAGLATPSAMEQPSEPVEAKPVTEADGVEEFLKGKTFLNFVNLHGKAVNAQYQKFCEANSFPVMKEGDFLKAVDAHFPELKRRGVRGGSVFEAA